jgi:hypothetical protein
LSRVVRVRAAILLGLALVPRAMTAQEQSLPAGDLFFLFESSERGLARELAAVAVSFQPPEIPRTVFAGEPTVRIYLAHDEVAFDSLTGGRAPDWGAGVAFPGTGVIVLPAFASARRGGQQALGQVLLHELAHLALQRHVGPLQVPHWFSEGYATWAAGQFDDAAGWMLRLAFLTGRAPPLDSLTLDWPSGTVDARLAYLLSASAVSWMYTNGGARAFGLFLERWRSGRDFEGALRATYGMTLGQFEAYWIQAVRKRYGWLLFVAQSAVIWAIIAVFVIALVAIRRRRDRARLIRLKATELPDDPAYWLEHPDEGPSPGSGTAPGTNGEAASPGTDPGGAVPPG